MPASSLLWPTMVVRYRNIVGLSVDGTAAEVTRHGPDLIAVRAAPGVREIEVVTGTTTKPAAWQPPAGAIGTAKALNSALAEGSLREVVIADGIYRDWHLKVPAQADPAPLVIRSATPGGVTLMGKSFIRVERDRVTLRGLRFIHCRCTTVQIVGANECRLTGCQFLHCGNYESTFGHIVEVGLGSDRNRVDHCYFTGSKSMSVAQHIRQGRDIGRDNRFDHNLFRDIYRYWVNGQENIQIGQNQREKSGEETPRCLVDHNVFDHAWGDGEILSSKSSGNTVRHNLAAHCYRSAFTLRGGNDVRFEGNAMVECSAGLRVMGQRHTIINNLFLHCLRQAIVLETGNANKIDQVATADTLIANNTMVDCRAGGIQASAATEGRPFVAERVTIENNLLTSDSGVLLDVAPMKDGVVRNNLVYPRVTAEVGMTGERAINSSPQLTGAGLGLRPQPSSPVIDRAIPLETVTHDWLGRRRPAGAGPDIGCTEVGAGTPTVELPAIPPSPLLDLDLYKGDLLYRQNADQPADGWQGDKARPEGPAFRLGDDGIELDTRLPEDFVLRWEYQPVTFQAKASVDLRTADGTLGYRIEWGGVNNQGRPTGLLCLLKGPNASAVADCADVVYYSKDFVFQKWLDRQINTHGAPDQNRWYRFELLHRNGRLFLTLGHTRGRAPIPVLIWQDAGALFGPAPQLAALRLGQQGGGRWRSVELWSYRYLGDELPVPVKKLRAETPARGVIRLSWSGKIGRREHWEIHRGPAEGFTPSADTLIGSSGTPSYCDVSLKAGDPHAYQVITVNQLGMRSEPVACQAVASTKGRPCIHVPMTKPATIEAPMALEPLSTGGACLTARDGQVVAGGASRERLRRVHVRRRRTRRLLYLGTCTGPEQG